MVPRPLRATIMTGTGQLQASNQIDQQVPFVQRDEHAARALDDPGARLTARRASPSDSMSIGDPFSFAARCGDTGRGRRTPSCSTWSRAAGRQPPNFGGVVVLFDARLNRLPVPDRQLAVPAHERRRHHRLADVRIGARYEDPAEQSPTSLSAIASEPAKRSMVSSGNPAFTETRRRAVPAGTVGGRIARTSKPSALKRARHGDRAFVVADRDRDDLRTVSRHRDAGSRQLIAHPAHARAAAARRRSGSSLTTSRLASIASASAGGARRRKHEGPRPLDQIVDRPARGRPRTRRRRQALCRPC